jgi:G3E family GTPase
MTAPITIYRAKQTRRYDQEHRQEPGPVDEHDHDSHDAMYERAVATPQRALSESELRHWHTGLPDAVLRVKGWVQLSDQDGVPALVQSVGRRLEITPTKQGAFPQDALLVLLGLAGSLRGLTAPDGSPLAQSL